MQGSKTPPLLPALIDPMVGLVLPAIGDGSLVRFVAAAEHLHPASLIRIPDTTDADDVTDDIDRRNSRQSATAPVARWRLSPPLRSPAQHHLSAPSSSSCDHPTETISFVPPGNLWADRTRLRLSGQRQNNWSGSNASNRSGSQPTRDHANENSFELPRLSSNRRGSEDSNAKHSSGTGHVTAAAEKVTVDGRQTARTPQGENSPVGLMRKDAGHVVVGQEVNKELTGRPPTHEQKQRTGTRREQMIENAVDDRKCGFSADRAILGGPRSGGLMSSNRILHKNLSNSITNLSRQTDVQGGAVRLHRNRSEVNLEAPRGVDDIRGVQQTVNGQRQTSVNQFLGQSLANQNPVKQVVEKQLVKSQSQPTCLFNQKTATSRKRTAERTSASSRPETEEEMEMATKTDRIIEWLVGIDGCAEPPESPVIFEDGPQQSDTAIHVIYEGD